MKIHRLSPRKMVEAWVKQQRLGWSSRISLPWAELFFCWGILSRDLVSEPSLDQCQPKLGEWPENTVCGTWGCVEQAWTVGGLHTRSLAGLPRLTGMPLSWQDGERRGWGSSVFIQTLASDLEVVLLLRAAAGCSHRINLDRCSVRQQKPSDIVLLGFEGLWRIVQSRCPSGSFCALTIPTAFFSIYADLEWAVTNLSATCWLPG